MFEHCSSQAEAVQKPERPVATAADGCGCSSGPGAPQEARQPATIEPIQDLNLDAPILGPPLSRDYSKLRAAIERFLPSQVLDEVLLRPNSLLFGKSCYANILFADLNDFTSMAETMEPRDVIDLLNEVLGHLTESVTMTGGIVDKFIGDAVMAVYGAPVAGNDDTLSAVEGALNMQRVIKQINRQGAEFGRKALRLGIGLATGDVIAGTIGSANRMDYTVIGDTVNLANRLERVTKLYGAELIVSEEAMRNLPDRVLNRELDWVRFRGRQRPEKIYEVFDSAADPEAFELAEVYGAGRRAYLAREFDKALGLFSQCHRLRPDDRPSVIMLNRAATLSTTEPPSDWDGIWRAA